MLLNHLRIAFRSIFKRKTFTVINILGLAVGHRGACLAKFSCSGRI
jgi:hypothetical protein